MKNIIIVLSVFIILASCGGAKNLKNKGNDAKSQTSAFQAQIEKLNAENLQLTSEKTQLTKSMSEMEMKDKNCAKNLKTCNAEINKIKSFYAGYKERLTKMKAELLATFPNNLNEVNFSIREEDGRLIVTIPNSILYPRGSAEFNEESLVVIQKLSQVFRANPNLQILVEGHTDETPLKKGGKYEDNWDLSVARAVNIVRQFETYGVHPKRLTAAGRGYFAPVNNLATEEARAQNRRTEIIIRPKIAELLKMMNELE